VTTAPERPRFEIRSDILPDHIVDGTRSRKRKEAYATLLQQPHLNEAIYAAFMTGTKRTHRDDLPPPPKNWKDLQKHPHRTGFEAALRKEYQAIEDRGTFVIEPRPHRHQVLPLIWVFTYKFDTDGYLTKYKARLCVRGDLQQQTIRDTYAATLAARSFRAIAALIAIFDLDAIQLDAINAFINSELDELVYCELPPGYQIPGKCIRLIRALYGLPRSPLLWLRELGKTLCKLGLTPADEDHCVYTNQYVTVIFYVDDIILLSKTQDRAQMMQFKEALMQTYAMREIGDVQWFLGIRILRDRDQRRLWLSQDSYIDKIVKRFGLETRKMPDTPMTEPLQKNEGIATAQQIHEYQQKVGSLLYAAIITRPDIALTAAKLSEFVQNPSRQHIDAVDRAICYLHGTMHYAIEYADNTGPNVFTGASDAAYADNADRKSSEGYLFTLFGGPIDWRATKQKTVTTSTTEAELLALSRAAKEMRWWTRFFNAIGFDIEHEPTIGCDNQQTIGLLTKEAPDLKTKLRHVDIHHHWLRQEVRAKRLSITWEPTNQMIADGLTKLLPKQGHQNFVRLLRLRDITSRIPTD
jgi:hypothetical protein